MAKMPLSQDERDDLKELTGTDTHKALLKALDVLVGDHARAILECPDEQEDHLVRLKWRHAGAAKLSRDLKEYLESLRPKHDAAGK